MSDEIKYEVMPSWVESDANARYEDYYGEESNPAAVLDATLATRQPQCTCGCVGKELGEPDILHQDSAWGPGRNPEWNA